MKNLAKWKRSRVATNGSYAEWDGFKCTADPILRASPDRVMPLLDEEQVLFCRLSTHTVKLRSLVLDVGTGSGVLGLWLAAKRSCRVVGIDVIPRALSFAKRNSKQNGISVVQDAASKTKRCVELVQADIELYAAACTQRYDVLLLNPPFTPTCPGFVVATHAFAGRNAQIPFTKQIALAPSLLTSDGHCLGYQMSYDRREGTVDAFDLVRRAFDGRCKISYAHVLNDKKWCRVDRFLRGQYQDFLSGTIQCPGVTSAAIAKYIHDVGGLGQCFSLVYYEVSRTVGVCRDPCEEVRVQALPDKTWNDRINLHRKIVLSAYRNSGNGNSKF